MKRSERNTLGSLKTGQRGSFATMERSKRPTPAKKGCLVAPTTIMLLILASWWPLSAILGMFTSAVFTAKFGNSPPQDEKDKTKKTPTETANLTDVIVSMELGWDHGTPPKWLQDICPEVVEHYDKFPSFQRLPHPSAPFMTTEFAAQSVCTLKVARLMAASIGTKLYIHAGSHLGAILHGQAIPFDDDVDAIMDVGKRDAFYDLCVNGTSVHEHVTVQCLKGWNAIKVWLQPIGMEKQTLPYIPYWSPFIDLFLFNITEADNGDLMLQETEFRPDWPMPAFPVSSFFPTRPYYFGGLYILGPSVKLARERYDFNLAKTPGWNHRLETEAPESYADKLLNATLLATRFPFRSVNNENIVTNGNRSQQLVAFNKAFKLATNTTISQRYEWLQRPAKEGQALTDALPGLDEAQVDNVISPQCSNTTQLRVVEFNADRGKWWLEAAMYIQELKQADVIILNEMDIGMARSDQQDTTRQMASFLGMNYAWGLEFVELTIGDADDRENIPKRLPNFHGLHGNAILSKCPIHDTVIYRNQVGDYFSSKKKRLNAYGLEKRLGGRMILLGRILVNGAAVVVGSVHKLGEKGQDLYGEVTEYIGSSRAVIAGDQLASFCGLVGLQAVVPGDGKGFTWPASCKGFGSARGDNVCTNMKELEPERTMKPCIADLGFQIHLGDHALIGVVLDVS